ncbi:MAG: hypothetical protein KIT09_16830 [Bryobacteraceae bacterium]|nr:hypothetical protein [Bryobacteraceae bacterium]
MRESLLRSFGDIWIDCLNGDKYKTGKVVPRGLPGEGTTDQSIFTTEHDPRGIQVGTGITTLLKRGQDRGPDVPPVVHHRNYWGRSKAKREALIATTGMADWPAARRVEAAALPEGPRHFETFEPSAHSRWKLVPFSAQGGFDDWPALDQLFVAKLQGVNPNRGLDGSVIDTDRQALLERMHEFFSDLPFDQLREKHPVLLQNRAGYDAQDVRKHLRSKHQFDERTAVPYVVFPLDQRWLYYEADGKLLNRPRPELLKNLDSNEFLVTVPEPRKESETRPVLLTTAFDLHLHDRGSVAFPAEVVTEAAPEGTLFAEQDRSSQREANLAPCAWTVLKSVWNLKGGLPGRDARALSRALSRLCLVVCHAPSYQAEHKESLAQDWAHVPVPKSRQLLDEIAAAGDFLATLLNPAANPAKAIKEILDGDAKSLAVPGKLGGGSVSGDELLVGYSFFGAAQGGWRPRAAASHEPMHDEWGGSTGDLYINDSVFFRHVPERVWRYELGGYPVIKKWLGYRDRGRRPGVPLSVQEMTHLRAMVHRLAAVLRLHPTLDHLYERACLDCYLAEELGL